MDIESSPINTEELDLENISVPETSQNIPEQTIIITCSPHQPDIYNDNDNASFEPPTGVLPEDSLKHTGYSNKAEFNGCGGWGSDCKSCCRFLCNKCCSSGNSGARNERWNWKFLQRKESSAGVSPDERCMLGGYLFNKTKSLYFFILYLFTGESDIRANVYKNYFKIEKAVDDNKISAFQILETIAVVCFELYKTLIGSFLTVFTSQRCGEQTCTIWQNFLPKNDLELAGLVCNFLMATALFIEYIFEIMREAYLIKYLRYDYDIANNGYHISELYESSDKTIFKKLIPLYIIYIRFSYVVLLVYIINVSISAVIIRENYYDNTSLFGFITNALFIIYKIYNVVEITSYKGNYFYSAYKRKNMHYNTIRPQYLLQPHTISIHDPPENPTEIPLSFTAQAPCNESSIHLPDIPEDIHISIAPDNDVDLSQENTNLTFQEILEYIRSDKSKNMAVFSGVHHSIMEESHANTDDNEDEEYDEENNWYIDEAYKRKLKRIQDMKNRRAGH